MTDDRRALQAMVRLQGDSDFKTFMDWIAERRDHARSNEGIKDDIFLRWSQGRAQEAKDIIDAVETARDVLNRMK